MIKRLEAKIGCFAKAGDDEPVFVLRATDKLAPALVREWARQFAVHYIGYDRSHWEGKYTEALNLAEAMEAWPNRKMPD